MRPRTHATARVAGAACTLLAAVGAKPSAAVPTTGERSAAPRSTYGPGGSLCSSPDRRLTISPPKDWAAHDYTGTSNWSYPDGSFRTCSWNGTFHEFFTDCERERTNGWEVNLVGDEASARFIYDISCGNEQPWRFVSPPEWGATHYHLHAPNDGSANVIDGFKAYVH